MGEHVLALKMFSYFGQHTLTQALNRPYEVVFSHV